MKLRMMTAALAAAGLALVGFTASAQGTPRGDLDSPHVTPQAVRTLHAFARCVALESPSEARALLAQDPESAGFVNGLMRLLDHNTHCLDHGSLAGNRRFFVARMAEALLLRDLHGGELAPRVAFDATRAPLQARDETELMSVCIVREAPAEVAALFGTEPAGSREAEAMRVLAPHFGSCLRQGVEGHFNRPAIRSMLALAAFRLSENNQAAQ
jgi:hypothetical protein